MPTNNDKEVKPKHQHTMKTEMTNTLEMLVETFTAKVATLSRLAETARGKWINRASNGLVLEGYDYYRNEDGKLINRIGINGTGYTGEIENALLFDTMDEAYNNGNFYLAAMVNGKRRTVHVTAVEAAPFFAEQAASYKKTLEFCKSRLAEINA